jgi:hypothetical protein
MGGKLGATSVLHQDGMPVFSLIAVVIPLAIRAITASFSKNSLATALHAGAVRQVVGPFPFTANTITQR